MHTRREAYFGRHSPQTHIQHLQVSSSANCIFLIFHLLKRFVHNLYLYFKILFTSKVEIIWIEQQWLLQCHFSCNVLKILLQCFQTANAYKSHCSRSSQKLLLAITVNCIANLQRSTRMQLS